ncbi:MAG: chorismate-binding protein [Bacteroidales bacterium]|nr:chorismate-binding protein [Bacteroidales bacterium]
MDFSVADAVSICVQNNLTFAAFRLPNQNQPALIVQSGAEPRTISPGDNYNSLNGFMVAPFAVQDCCPAFLIEPDLFYGTKVTEDIVSRLNGLRNTKLHCKSCLVPEEISKTEYLNLIRTIVGYIHQGTFEKVVPSRVKIVQGYYGSRLGVIFDLLCQTYSNAFVYIFNNGDHLWIGATPEPLLLAMNGTMQTVSLAGTRSFTEENTNIGAWNSKERLEQEYVTRYVSKVISHFNLTNVDLQGPYTKKAGNLLHLCTDFSFSAGELKGRLGEFINNLHPTPAVCGMPYGLSLELLTNLEKHNREYYAGYLGPVGPEGKLSLYVNLRCMKVLPDKLALFIGGGITADSEPEDEWLETEIKADTLLSIIHQL